MQFQPDYGLENNPSKAFLTTGSMPFILMQSTLSNGSNETSIIWPEEINQGKKHPGTNTLEAIQQLSQWSLDFYFYESSLLIYFKPYYCLDCITIRITPLLTETLIY